MPHPLPGIGEPHSPPIPAGARAVSRGRPHLLCGRSGGSRAGGSAAGAPEHSDRL